MDRTILVWVIGANFLAAGILWQRLDSLGYMVPLKSHVESLYETLGLFHASYPQCGLLNDTMFILTSSRVVHPDGVRPGASKQIVPTHVFCSFHHAFVTCIAVFLLAYVPNQL